MRIDLIDCGRPTNTAFIKGPEPATCGMPDAKRDSFLLASIRVAVLERPCSRQNPYCFGIQRPLPQAAIPGLWGAFLWVIPHRFRKRVQPPFPLSPESANVPPTFADVMKCTRAITVVYWDNHARVLLKNGERVYIINPSTTQHCRGGKRCNLFTRTFPLISKRWQNHTFAYVDRKLMRPNSRDCSCAFQCIAILLMYFVLGESGALTVPIPPTVYAFITRTLGCHFPPSLRKVSSS